MSDNKKTTYYAYITFMMPQARIVVLDAESEKEVEDFVFDKLTEVSELHIHKITTEAPNFNDLEEDHEIGNSKETVN